mmetsp:Transcript_7671/g.19110  ORF Transcript_7671/g.19110 Transcript_7671/m.19110 type:complete len:93 (-) Transcript_7671:555-833(-)
MNTDSTLPSHAFDTRALHVRVEAKTTDELNISRWRMHSTSHGAPKKMRNFTGLATPPFQCLATCPFSKTHQVSNSMMKVLCSCETTKDIFQG